MWVSKEGGKEGASGRAPLIGFGSVFSLIHKRQQRLHRGYLSSSVTAYSTLSPSLSLCVLPDPDPMYNSLLACSLGPCKLASSYFQ